ncbi:MAG: SLBB domain-containing protein [Ignavibacteriales bacterium]|nr:SLBB domain-containing protein [Ignavibacteriales bacterium]
MNIKILFSVLILAGFYTNIYSQDDIQIGSLGTRSGQQGGLFDYSNPSSINIKVQLWGYVRYPGYYIVPAGMSINELISFAGGPNEDASLDKIRVTKIKEGAQTKMMIYNYNDMVWEDEIQTQINFVRLEAGDIVVVPGEPRYFVRDDIAFYLGIVTTLASLTALILSIISFNN